MKRLKRCDWAIQNTKIQEEYIDYHDHEWGRPIHDDRLLFELLILEGVQAGLSWSTVLQKRAHYRKVYDGFDPKIVARYGPKKRKALLEDKGLVRNRLKIGASITNAKAFLAVQKEFGTFDRYIWGFVGGKPKINHWRTLTAIPALTPTSEKMSKDLKKRGFTFVGPTICYAYMQAIGMVNDHLTYCFLHKTLR